MGEFAGLVAVVTGGASGIGAATARAAADRGATVAVLDRSYSAVEGTSPLQRARATSLTPAPSSAAIATVVERLGGLDIVVNNAGIGAVGDVAANDDDEWHRVLDVNVVGIARVTRAALPHLRESPHAAIVNTCSVVAPVGVPQRALYCGQQGSGGRPDPGDGRRPRAGGHPGQRRHPRHRRHPLGRSAARPGRGRRAAAAAALRARQPMGRLVSADEVAHAIAYLASPLSASTTGTLLAVDGGMAGLRMP